VRFDPFLFLMVSNIMRSEERKHRKTKVVAPSEKFIMPTFEGFWFLIVNLVFFIVVTGLFYKLLWIR